MGIRDITVTVRPGKGSEGRVLPRRPGLARALQNAATMRRLPLLLLLAGCLEPEDDILLLDERFEEVPAAPRWAVSGEIDLVTTFHPAEHGLRFGTSGELVAPLGINIYDEYSDGHWVEYSTSCGDPPALRVEPQPDATWRIVLELPLGEPGSSFERVYASVPPLPAAEWGSPTTISSLVVRALAGGPCVIDNLRVYQPDNPVVW